MDFALSDFRLTLVLLIKTIIIVNDDGKDKHKIREFTLLGGKFHVSKQFSRFAGLAIDKVQGLRCTHTANRTARLQTRWQAPISAEATAWRT